MERETYLILRLTEARPESALEGWDMRGGTGAPKGLMGPEPAPPPEGLAYEIAAQPLDQQDYSEARRDPQVAGLARPMPLRLIAPVAAELSAQVAHPPIIHDAAWGVYATGALRSPYAGYGVTVAVLDTGIDADHEAFEGVTLIQRDFTGEGDGDENGHGTHVAGTIFGQSVGDVRIGVAPGVRRALIGKVLGSESSCTTQELVEAIQWAVSEGARIINMSLGFDFPGLVKWWVEEHGMETDLATSKALIQYRDNLRFFDALSALLRAQNAQFPSALVVAAAGNESRRQLRPDYVIEVAPPAAADGVLAVAALQSAGAPYEQFSVAPFSNIRALVAAPGVEIHSARSGGGYTTMSGTSMAAPHVAGLAALWAERQLQRDGFVRTARLERQLYGSASCARIQAAKALDVGEGLVAAPRD